MHGGGLIAEGGYGCVFHPQLTCAGKEISGAKGREYISKLQKEGFSATNEVLVGNILKKVDMGKHQLPHHFAPVLHSCPAKISHLLDRSDCKVIKEGKASSFQLMRIRYIEGPDLDSLVIEARDGSIILLALISNFSYLLKSIQLLIDAGICHNDLKGQNIVYDKVLSLPIIIDFGLSLPIKELKSENLDSYFYIYAPEYYIWPLEVHLLNLLLHISPRPNRPMLKELASDYTRKNAAIKGFSPQFIATFERLCEKQLQDYMALGEDKVVDALLDTWRTWDNYAIAIIYLKLVDFITRSRNGRLMHNPFVSRLVELLLLNIHPNPQRRMSPKKTLIEFNRILHTQDVERIATFADIVGRIARNKVSIDHRLKVDHRAMQTLARHTTRQ